MVHCVYLMQCPNIANLICGYWIRMRLSFKPNVTYCLEWFMRVYTSKLTPDSVVTYLFHDCERSLWLFCQCLSARGCDDNTVHLDWQLEGYQFATSRVRNVWGINRVVLRISISFSCRFAGFHGANRAVTRLLLLRRCTKYFSIFL